MKVTRKGDRGEVVKVWQRWLKENKYKPGQIDGKHGAKVEAATRQWLRDMFDRMQDVIEEQGWLLP